MLPIHPDPFTWNVGELPFYWGPLRSATNGPDLPDRLGFTLCMDDRTGLLMQTIEPENIKALKHAYRLGAALPGATDDTEHGREATDGIVDFLLSSSGLSSLSGRRALEVGCGTGSLLHRLKELGAEVVGVEPGPIGQIAAARYGFPVIQDFFPSEQIGGQFDFVVMYMVLEHFENARSALSAARRLLRDGGHLVVAVEDEEPYLNVGDPSILFHEHFSYFTGDTLRRFLTNCGFSPTSIVHPSTSRILYGAAGLGPTEAPAVPAEALATDRREAESYRERVEKSVRRITHLLGSRGQAPRQIGFYVPGRAMNILALSTQPHTGWRFFDDDPRLLGTYYPGWPVPVENRADLLARPPEELLVMSASFGRQLCEQLAEQLPRSTTLRSWHDVFPLSGQEFVT